MAKVLETFVQMIVAVLVLILIVIPFALIGFIYAMACVSLKIGHYAADLMIDWLNELNSPPTESDVLMKEFLRGWDVHAEGFVMPAARKADDSDEFLTWEEMIKGTTPDLAYVIGVNEGLNYYNSITGANEEDTDA